MTSHSAKFAAIALACAMGCAVAPARAIQTFRDVPFPSPGSPGGIELLDLFLPDAGGAAATSTIILVHSGAYSQGDKNEFDGACAALAARGFAAITIDYVLLTPAMTSAGIGTFPQPTCDVLNAVHWVRTQGQALSLPDRVFVGGFSAGATIGLNAAMAAGNSRFNVLPSAAGSRGDEIDGAIGMSGRYDLIWNAGTGMPAYVADYLGQNWWSGGNWQPRLSDASAVSYVDQCSPPTVLFHGDSDGLVPVGNAYRLQQAMNAAGAPVLLHVAPGGGHDISALGATDAAVAVTLDTAVQWMIANTQAGCGRVVQPPPDPVGTCCSPMGLCVLTTQIDCGPSGGASAAFGTWRPPDDASPTCNPNPCPAPVFPGACCMGAVCAVRPQGGCVGPATSFVGAGVSCNARQNTRRPCCVADFNQDGILETSDVFMYLNAWFAGDQRCIVTDTSGPNGGPTINDVFSYLGDWFGGC